MATTGAAAPVGPPVHTHADRCTNRCAVCKRATTLETENILSDKHLDLLDYMRAIHARGDDGHLNCDDARDNAANKFYGEMLSRKTGKSYRAPRKLVRTLMRVLEAFDLVDYKPRCPTSGHKINQAGLDFLAGKISVPRSTYTKDGGVVGQTVKDTVTIATIGFAPNPTRPIYLYP